MESMGKDLRRRLLPRTIEKVRKKRTKKNQRHEAI